jgi:hypothetical protein
MTRRWSLSELSWNTCYSIFSSNINRNWSGWLIVNIMLSILLWRLSINRSTFKNIHLIICLIQKLIISSSISLMKEIYHSMSTTRTWIGLSSHLHSNAMVFHPFILIDKSTLIYYLVIALRNIFLNISISLTSLMITIYCTTQIWILTIDYLSCSKVATLIATSSFRPSIIQP